MSGSYQIEVGNFGSVRDGCQKISKKKLKMSISVIRQKFAAMMRSLTWSNSITSVELKIHWVAYSKYIWYLKYKHLFKQINRETTWMKWGVVLQRTLAIENIKIRLNKSLPSDASDFTGFYGLVTKSPRGSPWYSSEREYRRANSNRLSISKRLANSFNELWTRLNRQMSEQQNGNWL